ncbi:MAG TPA: universal stress protein [Chthoniobacterales bacterium]
MPGRAEPKKVAAEDSPRTSALDQRLEIRTVLVPLDLSAASMQTLNYAIPIAERFQADLHLVYVHENGHEFSADAMSQLLHESAEMRMRVHSQGSEAQADLAGLIRAENCHVLSGRAYQKACDFARELAADLIVLATRGHTGLARVVLGSTAERIVQFAPCPVLVTRQRGRPGKTSVGNGATAQFKFSPRKMLVPVDFSQCSLAGLKYAAFFARVFDAKLRLFHTLFPRNPVVVDRISANLAGGLDEARRMNAQLEMEALMQLEFLRGVQCETEIRSGYAIQEICAEIERADVDLVITSTHGQTGMKHALLGSVAEHVVRYAECPVLVVPSDARTKRALG